MSFSPANAVVWTEIPVRDADRGIAFYSAVFGYDMSIDDSGPNPISFIPTETQDGIAGHLYPGVPASGGSGATVHFLVPDTLEATVERCEIAGGEIKSPPVQIPPGRFQYALDPDGNSIGLFEPNKG